MALHSEAVAIVGVRSVRQSLTINISQSTTQRRMTSYDGRRVTSLRVVRRRGNNGASDKPRPIEIKSTLCRVAVYKSKTNSVFVCPSYYPCYAPVNPCDFGKKIT